jgi:hypothetical protein
VSKKPNKNEIIFIFACIFELSILFSVNFPLGTEKVSARGAEKVFAKDGKRGNYPLYAIYQRLGGQETLP